MRISKFIQCSVVAMLLGASACGQEAGDDSNNTERQVTFEFADDIYGVITSDAELVFAELFSVETDELVGFAELDPQTHERTFWLEGMDEEIHDTLPRLEGVDRDVYLANDLAVIRLHTDDDPSNDEFDFGDDGEIVHRSSNNHQPKGRLDLVQTINGQRRARVAGWTCDADRYAQQLTIHLYNKGATFQSGLGSFVGSRSAGLTRESAVAGQCGGYPTHGFDTTTGTLTQTRGCRRSSTAWVRATAVGVAALNVRSNGTISGSHPVIAPGFRGTSWSFATRAQCQAS